MTILEEIINAMTALGGHSCYKDLYPLLKEKGISESSTRDCIQRHSSDCKDTNKKYSGKDIFYSVEGIGQGHWGLREPIITETNMDVSNDDEGFFEGKLALKKHLVRERNHSVKMSAIKKFKDAHNGKVYCEICNFDFYNNYGDIGKDFVEAHHSKPISEMKENERTRIDDIVLLCSNCHSMIHRKRPWLQKEDIKTLLFSKKN